MKPSVTSVCLLLSLLGCQPAVPTPSLSPSAEPPLPVPTSPVTPTPYPESSPQPTSDPRIGVTHFTSQIACEDFSPEQLRRLEAPQDLVVSRDGQTLYITPETAFIKSWRSNGSFQTERIARTPLYKLQNGHLEVLNQSNNAAYSCGWNGEIERWQDDQVLFTYPQMVPGFDPRNVPLPIVSYSLYTRNGNTFQQRGQIQMPGQNFLPNGIYHPGQLLRNLHMEQNQQVYYQLDGNNLADIQRVESYDLTTQAQKEIEDILTEGLNLPHLFINWLNDRELLLNLIPSTTEQTALFSFLTAPVSCPGWSSEKAPILSSQPRFYRGSYYFSDAVNHMIWSHVPGTDIRCVAGGQRGFADGKGQAARFREPAELVFDDVGNLYVADKGNDAIRKITPSGEVSTLYQAP